MKIIWSQLCQTYTTPLHLLNQLLETQNGVRFALRMHWLHATINVSASNLLRPEG